jgi:hypothetical protein
VTKKMMMSRTRSAARPATSHRVVLDESSPAVAGADVVVDVDVEGVGTTTSRGDLVGLGGAGLCDGA